MGPFLFCCGDQHGGGARGVLIPAALALHPDRLSPCERLGPDVLGGSVAPATAGVRLRCGDLEV